MVVSLPRVGEQLAIVAIALLALLFPSATAARPNPDQRVEKRVRSKADGARKVRESYVRLRAPLPPEVGAHPESCDWLGYLRFRNRGGPRKARNADAVVVAIPGFLGGAASFDQLARNVVRRGAAKGKDLEFWGLDRRANCLEDHTGVRASKRARDPRPAFGYYYGDEEVEGRRFGGFATSEEAEFLEHFGLARTMRDWYTVVKRELPGQPQRRRKLLCGGHSLGGPLTAAFASWDFDGDPETKRDAGFKQCAGLFGLDTTLSLEGSQGGPAGVAIATELAAGSGTSPYVNAPPLTPGTMQLPSIIGVAAFQAPDAETVINELIPSTPEYELTLRLLYSRDAAHFATGEPSIRDFRLTNATVLGGVFDDNSAGISILRSSVGFIVGGPLTDKNFPAPDPTLALPQQPNGPLYAWQDYDAVGAGGAPLEPNDSGQPYTSRESEVSELRELARVMFEAPANFIEQYFPVRILTDTAAALGGDRSGDLENIRHDGVGRRPALLIQAGDSDDNSGADEGGPQEGAPPNAEPLSRELILPGYNHLDVVTAARRQNDGAPEPSAKALARFALKVTKEAAR